MGRGAEKDALWTDEQTRSVVEVFFEKRAAIGEGGNFKAVTYREAAVIINRKYPTQDGAAKKQASCQYIWTKVRHTM